MARITISEDGTTPHPNNDLTSRTPPPPGFESNTANNANAEQRSDTPNTCKSTSFNNLAMAFGTGLAECMDESTSETTKLQKPPNRIHTPDTYTRQSRHSARFMGSSGGGAGGFDYLNSAGTSHMLIPPSNSAYLDKLKAGGAGGQQQQQQQQMMGMGGIGNTTGGMGNQLDSANNSGMFASRQQHQSSQQSSNGSSLAQAMASMDQKPVRFTAAMMASAQSGTGGYDATFQSNTNNQAAGAAAGNNEMPSPILASTNSQNLNQELLRQQFLQQQSNMNNGANQGVNNAFGQSNSNTIGVTVVEPSSTRNSPAPQRGGATMIGMNGDGLLYPLMQQQQKGGGGGGGPGQQQRNSMPGTSLAQAAGGGYKNAGDNDNASHAKERDNFLLGVANAGALPGIAATGNILNFAAPTGGRASAPPPQSQPFASPFPGGMTTVVMNNAAIRAYTASSLQMRVAELHQELGNGAGANKLNAGVQVAATPGGMPVTTAGGMTMAAAPPGTVMLRTVPAGTTTAIPIVLTPAPTPPPPTMSAHVPSGATMRPPSRGGGGANTPDPLLNKQITRSSSPGSGSTITNSPMPSAPNLVAGVPPVTSPSPTFDEELRERERAAVRELAPFLRDPPSKSSSASNGSGSSSVSTRGLAILYASSLYVPDVRSTCEAFGALESFRSDFGESRGVFFATFYDLRSAQLAVGELPSVLNKLGSSGVMDEKGGRVQVKYCVPLNSSSATDESMLMLSNLPGSVDEQDLNHVLASFGAVRAIHYQANMSEEAVDEGGGEELTASYLVEFYDIQDARQALLELEQTNPWSGGKTKVKVGTRSPTKRKQGKDLILLLSCWRQGVVAPVKGAENNNSRQSPLLPQQQQRGSDSIGDTESPTPSPSPTQPAAGQQQQSPQLQQQDTLSSQTARTSHVQHQNHQMDIAQNNSMGSAPAIPGQPYYQQYPNHLQGATPQQYQLVVGPDGQYSYALVNHPHHPQMVGHPYGQMGQMVIDPHHQQQHIMMYSPIDQHYQMHNPHQLNMNMNAAAQQQQYHIQYNGGVMPGTNYHAMPTLGQAVDAGQPPTPFIRLPSGNDVNSSSLSSGSSPGRRKSGPSTRTGKTGSTASIGSGSSGGNNSGGNNSGGQNSEVDDQNHNLTLNIENVRSGKDRRSSLMVRNIPNKYTQQMLLSEFASAGHGSTKMDFFYLPIDFKNKCNRGYAFVNFVDYKDICAFFDEYNGTSWKRFNSDKICDITYARIQGKAAMLKRFENSALMEKDDEYRPKVFVSHGERKGQVESMPMMGSAGFGRVIQ